MDAEYTGRKIADLRKQQGLTQKQFAELLHVTDKAVSKWERGLNFPELPTLERIALLCQVTIPELLGLEDSSGVAIATEVTSLAREEKNRILIELSTNGWYSTVAGTIAWFGALYASKVLDDHGLYGLPQMATMGMLGFLGSIISNGIHAVLSSRKLRKL